MKPIVLQAIMPLKYKTYDNGGAISAREVRCRISKFILNNMPKNLGRLRDDFVCNQHRLKFVAPFDFSAPSFRKSVRISSETDALLSEYAGIMQIPKRHVVWMAVALPDSQYPDILPLNEVLKQADPMSPALINFWE